MRLSTLLTTLIAAAALAGCDGIGYDLDSVEFQPRSTTDTDQMPDMLGDVGPVDMTDAGPIDVGTDSGPDASIDMGVDMGPTCAIEHPIDELCNPTVAGECPENGFCALAGGPPPTLRCLPRSNEGTVGDGEACSGNDCVEGLTCVIWGLREPDPQGQVCSKFCEIDTNIGCDEGEFCTANAALPPMEGIGVCRESCDPYDANACPSGSTCNVDYNYPAGTCLPHFRCVESTGFVSEGEECGPGTQIATCSEGLLCYEVDTADFQCVVPCQADGDCTNATCGDPAGAFGLRYCQ